MKTKKDLSESNENVICNHMINKITYTHLDGMCKGIEKLDLYRDHNLINK